MSTSKKKLLEWLKNNGFEELPRKATSHRQFAFNGVKVAVPDHGSKEMDPKLIDLMAKRLAVVGFDPKKVKEELKL